MNQVLEIDKVLYLVWLHVPFLAIFSHDMTRFSEKTISLH